MPDLDAATNRNRHAKEWLQDRARRLNDADHLPLHVREHFARDVPELAEEIKRLRRGNDILMKWYLASEQDRVAMQAIVDAATSWYRSTPDVQDRRDTEAIAIAAYEFLTRRGLGIVPEVPQLPWSKEIGVARRVTVDVKFRPEAGDIVVRDTTNDWSVAAFLAPDVAIEKGLALLRAGLQAKVLSASPTGPEIEESP